MTGARTPYKCIYTERPSAVPSGRVLKQCEECLRWFSMPQCHTDSHKSCSKECGQAIRQRRKLQSITERLKNCAECGKQFSPRGTQIRLGQGKFCSLACRGKNMPAAIFSDEARAKARAGYLKARAENRVKFYSGEENAKWKGGRKASLKRRIESGSVAAAVKKYRKENPERAKEWAHSRRSKKLGKLPPGTIGRILGLQRDRCANCGIRLNGKYHVDHIIPLARDGQHVKDNIQILCQPCNTRKWAKDPIAFAAEEGRLL